MNMLGHSGHPKRQGIGLGSGPTADHHELTPSYLVFAGSVSLSSMPWLPIVPVTHNSRQLYKIATKAPRNPIQTTNLPLLVLE